MEIMIKAKQKFNPFFSFLSLYDSLYPYYRHLLQLMLSGAYVPRPSVQGNKTAVKDDRGAGEKEGANNGRGGEGGGGGSKNATPAAADFASESDEDSDDEGFELHPLLRVSTTPRSSPKPSASKHPTAHSGSTSATPTSMYQSHTHPFSSSDVPSLYSRSLNVNAAPSLDSERGRENEHTSTAYPYGYPQPSHER